MDQNTLQVVAYVASGATIGSALAVPIIKHLGRNWLKQREDFEQVSASKLALLQAGLLATEKAMGATIQAVREEGINARTTLREHVDHEDGILRERNHQLAGSVGVLTNKVEIASLDVRAAIAANKETLDWCQSKYSELLTEVHRIALEMASLPRHTGETDERGERRVRQVRRQE